MTKGDRQEQIVAATERLLGRGGVEAVTMRAVAAEAGVSLRLVQYYGRSKDELLTATLDRLAAKSVQRWQTRAADPADLADLADPADPAGTGPAIGAIRSFVAEALPTNEQSRAFHRVGVSLEMLAVTGTAAAGAAYRRHLEALADHLAELLATDGRTAGEAARLAREVMAFSHGLGTLVMAGVSTAEDAEAIAAEYLDQLQRRLSG